MEKGDIVECIDVSNQPSFTPLVLGRKYIVQCVATCNCSQMIDIGYTGPWDGVAGSCFKCRDKINIPGMTWWFSASRFRKIGPLYKVVEVSESILKKELVFN